MTDIVASSLVNNLTFNVKGADKLKTIEERLLAIKKAADGIGSISGISAAAKAGRSSVYSDTAKGQLLYNKSMTEVSKQHVNAAKAIDIKSKAELNYAKSLSAQTKLVDKHMGMFYTQRAGIVPTSGIAKKHFEKLGLEAPSYAYTKSYFATQNEIARTRAAKQEEISAIKESARAAKENARERDRHTKMLLQQQKELRSQASQQLRGAIPFGMGTQGVLGGIPTPLVGMLGIGAIAQKYDNIIGAQGRIQAVSTFNDLGKEGALNNVFKEAEALRIDASDYATLLSRIGLVTEDVAKETGYGSRGLLDFTTTIFKGMRYSGAGTQQAASIMTQLPQALVGDAGGEELRALVEGMGAFANDLAKAIKNPDTGNFFKNAQEMKKWTGVQGNDLTPKMLMDAALSFKPIYDERFLKLPKLFSDAWNNAGTQVSKIIIGLERDTGFFSKTIEGLLGALKFVDKAIRVITDATGGWGNAMQLFFSLYGAKKIYDMAGAAKKYWDAMRLGVAAYNTASGATGLVGAAGSIGAAGRAGRAGSAGKYAVQSGYQMGSVATTAATTAGAFRSAAAGTIASIGKFAGTIGLLTFALDEGISILSGQRSFLMEMWAKITGDKSYGSFYDAEDAIRRKQGNAALLERISSANAEVGYEKFTAKKQEDYSFWKDTSLAEKFTLATSLITNPESFFSTRKEIQDRYSSAPRLEQTEANKMFKHYRDPVSGVALQTDERIPEAVNSANRNSVVYNNPAIIGNAIGSAVKLPQLNVQIMLPNGLTLQPLSVSINKGSASIPTSAF
jgi:tape measure domain-containing protein